MARDKQSAQQQNDPTAGRRGFFFAALGGLVAAAAGWIAGAFPRPLAITRSEAPIPTPLPTEASTPPPLLQPTITALQEKVEQLSRGLASGDLPQKFAQLEGEANERIVFNKAELTVTNPEGVLLNLVATKGHVGIRFYKDFDFGNEQQTNPWHLGFIEGIPGYQGLAILRDWRFTAALWGEDGRLLLGNLHPHPPANEPAKARVHVRGTVDEVQTLVEASPSQSTDIFQVVGAEGSRTFAIDASGSTVVGSSRDPRGIVLHDTTDGTAYVLQVTNGQLAVAKA